MNPLSTSTVYVATKCLDDLPDFGTEYFVIDKFGGKTTDEMPFDDVDNTHWLKPVEGYLLSKEQILNLISDAWDKSLANHHNFEGGGGYITKEQFINSIIK